MKKVYLLSLCCLLLTQVHYAQQKFDKWWDEIEELELQGKSVSALERAEKIKRKADRKENPQQFLKAFLYVAKYKLILKKDSEEEVYQDFLTEIEDQNAPTRQVLYSFLAESLNDYYKENRYRINQHTNTDSIARDFLTWSKDDFQSKIMSYYQKSLSSEQKLIETPLKDFTEILNYGENYNNYRSTLYDVLANRYLTFLKHHNYNPENKKSHYLIETEFYGLPKDFVSIDLSAYEDGTQKIATLKTYQDLTRLHLQQKNALSVVITTLERFEYLKEKGSYSTPKENYRKALLKYLNAVKTSKEKVWIHYKLAEFYYQNANKKTTPDYLNKSLYHIEKIKDLLPNSHPGKQALKIERAITSSQITIKTKQKPLPHRKFRALVNFKNTDSLYLRIYQIPQQVLTQYDYRQDSLARDLYRNAKVFQQQEFQLPKIENHFSYSTELLLDELPVGNYVLLFSKAKTIDLEKSDYQFQQLQITNLSYTSFDFREDQQLFVTNRTTGQPLENVKVFLKTKPKKIYTTNQDGLVKIHHKPQKNYQQEAIKLIYKKDTLDSSLRFRKNYSYSYSDDQDPEIRSHLFTDRGIYRPGQTIYFKGILSYQSETERKVVSGERVYVELYDENYDLVDSLSLRTNEFGSVQGEFKIPKNVLTGEFEIALDEDFEENSPYYDAYFNDTYTEVRVEEYKRPKFEVEFNAIDSTYVLIDSLQLKGKAKAFFGGNITNAQVKYTVERKLNYNYRYNYSYHSRSSERLTTGETTTDAKGNFTIDFKAIPDEDIDSGSQPTFTYSVEATVTDVNGETHTASQNIRVGYHATEISIQAPYETRIGENQELKIYARDLNNLASTAEGELKVYKYVKPDRILTKRSWAAPEIQQIPKEKFIAHFPFTPYDSLDLKENWPKKLINTIPLKIDSLATLQIDDYKEEWRTGDYIFEFKGKGKLGYEVEAETKKSIKNPKDKLDQIDKNFINYTYDLKEVKGKKEVNFKFTTLPDSLPILINLAFDDSLVKQEIFQLKKGENSFTYTIPKETENIYLEYVFNRLGYYFKERKSVNLPQPVNTKENLEFEVLHFKNKLEPGSQETWRLKVIDHHKKPANAEVLASMYDASLDEFVSHNWYTQLYRTPYSYKGNGLPNSSIHLNNYYTNNFHKSNYYTPSYYSYSLSYSFFQNFGYHFTNTTNTNKIYLKHLIKEIQERASKNDNVSKKVTELDEVLVTAYGNQKKESLTGSVTQVLNSSPGVQNSNDSTYVRIRGIVSINNSSSPLYIIDGKIVESATNFNPSDISSLTVLKDASATALYGSRGANGVIIITTKAAEEELTQVETRTNLKETAFFFPQLKTNKKGEVIFEFESPEALTRWNFQAFAHDKNLHQAKLDLTTITQKDLNIIPNFPRFFRSKDTLVISAKVNNLSKKVLNGMIQLEFTDEVTQEKIKLVTDKNTIKNFQISPKGNTEVSWTLFIPEGLSAARYRIVARAGNFSDGEESIIPVLSNRIFITETLPIWVNPKEKKSITFNNLKNNTSTTLENHQLVFEYTSNPAWTSLQALPYLIEYPHDCAEQTFSKMFANYLTTVLLEKNPEIQQTLQQWKSNKTELSPFNTNEELKQIVLQETPWLKDAETEEEQQKRLAQLLDIQETKAKTQQALNKLSELQLSSGAFPWFSGGRANRAISLHILKGMGRLLKIAPELEDNDTFDDISIELIDYLDEKFLNQDFKRKDFNFYNSDLNYVYARSFFEGFKDEKFEAFKTLLLEDFDKKWITLSIQSKLTLAMVAHRYEKQKLAKNILASLKENAVIESEYGMYWKEVVNSRAWYNAPIATQALAIEAFAEIEKDEESINQLKTWLLRNKKTEAWSSTKATTEAVYALLIQGDQDYLNGEAPKIKIGDQKLVLDSNHKAGYIKTRFPAEEITPEMAEVEIKNNSDSPQYGAMYWQYFEEADQVKANNQAELSIEKELFKKVESNEGTTLVSLDETSLKIGDLVTVRLVIKAKENFSFMHLKDMRAAGLEPVDVLSTYKWQDGLGYYQSTKDVATHFFFDEINQGTYVFEYDLRVNNPGNFSNGISQLQSMYAPEFKVQTEGSRVELKKK
ncbi:MAG: MG2 domain-containing protein [Mesonia sp.]|uniref:alpha-2-macroglobulin family protein n=1 Tax=Mesonia sp. TaxID=1960830 RepID=UPI0032423C8D